MMIARVIFKNKSGWNTCGPAFRKAETEEQFKIWAEKKAKGREYVIQIMSEEMARIHMNDAEQI